MWIISSIVALIMGHIGLQAELDPLAMVHGIERETDTNLMRSMLIWTAEDRYYLKIYTSTDKLFKMKRTKMTLNIQRSETVLT